MYHFIYGVSCIFSIQILDYLGKSSDTDSSSPIGYLSSRSRCECLPILTYEVYLYVNYVSLTCFLSCFFQSKDVDLSDSYTLSHVSGLWLQVTCILCLVGYHSYIITSWQGGLWVMSLSASWRHGIPLYNPPLTALGVLSDGLTNSSENCCSWWSWEFKSLHFPN